MAYITWSVNVIYIINSDIYLQFRLTFGTIYDMIVHTSIFQKKKTK